MGGEKKRQGEVDAGTKLSVASYKLGCLLITAAQLSLIAIDHVDCGRILNSCFKQFSGWASFIHTQFIFNSSKYCGKVITFTHNLIAIHCGSAPGQLQLKGNLFTNVDNLVIY